MFKYIISSVLEMFFIEKQPEKQEKLKPGNFKLTKNRPLNFRFLTKILIWTKIYLFALNFRFFLTEFLTKYRL